MKAFESVYFLTNNSYMNVYIYIYILPQQNIGQLQSRADKSLRKSEFSNIERYQENHNATRGQMGIYEMDILFLDDFRMR